MNADGRTERETSIRRGVEMLLSLVQRAGDRRGRLGSHEDRRAARPGEEPGVAGAEDAGRVRAGRPRPRHARLPAGLAHLRDGKPRRRAPAARLRPAAARRSSCPSSGSAPTCRCCRAPSTITILSHQSPRAVQARRLGGPHHPGLLHVGRARRCCSTTPRAELELLFGGVEFEPLGAEHGHGTWTSWRPDRVGPRARLRHRRRGDGAGTRRRRGPVRDAQGRIVAALNVSAPKYRFERRVDRVGAALVAAAGELGAALRGERPANVAEGG